MSSNTLRTQIEIAAPPSRVWDVLTDFDRWPQWNRLLRDLRLHGPLCVGTRGDLHIQLPFGKSVIGVRLCAVRHGVQLEWKGGIPGVMTGCHGFTLHPVEQGTRFVHTETFEGTLAGVFVRLAHGQMHHRYQRFNEALRDRCEQG